MNIETFYKQRYDQSVKQMKWRTKSKEDAEDIVQNAFERAVRYSHVVKDIEFCFPFILNNCFRDWVKSNKDRGMTRSINEEDENIPVEIISDLKEEAKVLIKNKTGIYKDILVLYFEKGFTQEQIAEMLGTSRPLVSKYVLKFKNEVLTKIEGM